MEKSRFWLIYLKTFKKFSFLGRVSSILTFLKFSQKCAEYIDPSGHFVFFDIFVAQTSRTSFFSSIVVKLNISVISKATILIFVVNLPLWYKFHKKRNFEQTTWRTSGTTSRFEQNFIKDENTGRVDIHIYWRIF